MSSNLTGFFIILLSIFFVLPHLACADEQSGRGFVLWAGSGSAETCLTAECHADLGRAKYVHAPVAEGDCLVCHGTTDQPHPGADSIVLLEEEPGLCFQCHENPAEGMAYPHSAVAEGCTGCHNPHQGGLPKLVVQSGGQLCLVCHEDVDDGKYVHGPVRAINCKICHGIHGGDNLAMLNRPGNGNCLGCHPGIQDIMDNAVSQHEPVVSGFCWDCHTPHASEYKPFLQEYYPEEFYTSYKKEKFSLCFRCHDDAAFTYELTSEATAFRNHNDNLHYFHVNRQSQGRVCKTCHGVHGAAQNHLLLDKIKSFGHWAIPLTWVSDGDRATCYVGCHQPKTYSRNSKVSNL